MGNSSSASSSSAANAPTVGPASKHFEETLATLPESLEGKSYAVTGCTSGTGLVLARVLATRGGRVFMLNRPSERAKLALQHVQDAAGSDNAGNVAHIDCDLMDFEAVRAAATELRAATNELDVLVNNAGIMAFRDLATKDGYDIQMQTNHLSHFLLTAEVWPLLEAAADARGEARVVQHSSITRTRAGTNGLAEANLGKNGGALGGDARQLMPGTGPRWDRYSQTKLANVGFCLALRDRIAATAGDGRPAGKVLSLVAHPGVAFSGLTGTTTSDGGLSWMAQKLLPLMQQSTEDGTLGVLRCAIGDGIPSGSLVGPTGRKGPAVVMDQATEEARVPPAKREMLWRLSCEATGVTDFFPDPVAAPATE